MSTSPFEYTVTRLLLLATLVVGWAGVSAIHVRQETIFDEKLTAFYDLANEIEVITVGSSHNRGIHFPSLGRVGMSFFDSDGDIAEARIKLERIVPHTSKLKFVIMPLAPGSIAQPGQRDWLKPARYYALANRPNGAIPDPAEIALLALSATEISARQIRSHIVRTFTGGGSRRELPCQRRPMARMQEHEFGVTGGYLRERVSTDCIARLAQNTDHRHKSMAELSEARVIVTNVSHLEAVAALLDKVGAMLILVEPPFAREYMSHPVVVSLTKLQSHWLDRLNALKNVHVMDYKNFFYRPPYVEDDALRYFYDADHLIIVGAIDFSHALAADIGNLEQQRASSGNLQPVADQQAP